MATKKELKKAYDKAIRITKLLGIQMTEKHKDGSISMHKPPQPKGNQINILDIMEIILDE